MPYITKQRRDELGDNRIAYETAETSGELNYQITQVILQYLDDKGKSYSTINDILGALEGAKLEFYRRVVAPYENLKNMENGDVY